MTQASQVSDKFYKNVKQFNGILKRIEKVKCISVINNIAFFSTTKETISKFCPRVQTSEICALKCSPIWIVYTWPL